MTDIIALIIIIPLIGVTAAIMAAVVFHQSMLEEDTSIMNVMLWIIKVALMAATVAGGAAIVTKVLTG